MFCQRGFRFFSACFVCVVVVVVGGGDGFRFSTSTSVKKITDPPPINK